MDRSLAALTALEGRDLIVSGEISPRMLLEACIEQVAVANPVVNALVTEAFERARQEADAAGSAIQRGEALGALHGLPVAIKDNQLTEGVRTTFGSPSHRDMVPTVDAGIVARIRAAGGIVIGKTNIPEFSIGANTINPLFGATGNPFDPKLTCGGSSGGSAVAVATNMVPLATGSDHGGSLRIPASYCGVVGYRATPGVVPNEERLMTLTNYSVQGPVARTVTDAALLLSVIAGRSTGTRRDPMAFPLDAARFAQLDTVDLSALRVAVTADLGGVLVSRENKEIFRQRVDRFAHHFRVCDWHDIDLTLAPGVDWHLRQDIFVTQYHDQANNWPADFNPNIRATYESAVQTPMADIARARRTQVTLFREMNALFDDYDLLVLPGMSIPPFPWADLNPREIDGKPVENYMAWLALTSSLSVVGHPVVALPCGLDARGTPFGIQVVGPMYSDHALLGAAHALEQAFSGDIHLRRPVAPMSLA
ncbi:MAG: amidase [Pseudomonadota bacterium]